MGKDAASLKYLRTHAGQFFDDLFFFWTARNLVGKWLLFKTVILRYMGNKLHSDDHFKQLTEAATDAAAESETSIEVSFRTWPAVPHCGGIDFTAFCETVLHRWNIDKPLTKQIMVTPTNFCVWLSNRRPLTTMTTATRSHLVHSQIKFSF